VLITADKSVLTSWPGVRIETELRDEIEALIDAG
jgi:hypothetical protein